jgi:large subunit ribosomal protein L29
MKASEIRKLNIEELRVKGSELKQELFNIKFQLHTGRLENSAKIGQIRKEIAQVNTIITEKQV